jgi:hypothetical protein
VSTRAWWLLLGAASSARVAVPLVVLAASGHDAPGLPAYDYAPLNGDANGFYAATREMLASFGRVTPVVLTGAICGLVIATLIGDRLWRHGGSSLAALLLPALAASLLVTLLVRVVDREDVAVGLLVLGDDILGIESKVGRISLDPRIRQELARDWWLMRQGQLDRVRWEFSPNEAGQIGPTRPLFQKLHKLRFEVQINPENPTNY